MTRAQISGQGGDLSAAIRDKRQREGLSLRDSAEASGVAFSTLARIEAGKTPSLKVDRQIRHWLTGETPTLPTPPMTLRDWFAGQALAGMGTWCPCRGDGYAPSGDDAIRRAKSDWAYAQADAMLAERERAA